MLRDLLVLVGCVVAFAALATLVVEARDPDVAAREVLVVPPVPSSGVATDPLRSRALAGNYVSILRRDPEVRRAVQTATRQSAAEVERRFTVAQGQQDATIRLRLEAPSSARAQKGLSEVAGAIEERRGRVAEEVVAGTLRIIAPPSKAIRLPSGLYRSSAYMIVAAPNVAQVDPISANRLAANLAGLIPEDEAVIRSAARSVRVSSDELRSRLRVANDANTSLITVNYRGTTYANARAAVIAIGRAVASDTPISPRFPPGILRVARAPAMTGQATAPDGDGAPFGLLAGAVVGALIGCGLVLLRRRRNPALRSVSAARALLAMPVVAGDSGSIVIESGTTLLMPMGARARAWAERVTPPDDGQGVVVAPDADAVNRGDRVLLILETGTRTRQALALVDDVRTQGGDVEQAVLVSAR